MKKVHQVTRISASNDLVNPVDGECRISWSKVCWFLVHVMGALLGIWFYTTLTNFLVFAVFTALTLCLGHTIGLHRLLIHRSFSCHLGLKRILVHLGTLVGMGGPFQMIYLHEIRDWAQRHERCHAWFIHRNPLWRDALWQLLGEIRLSHPPTFTVEEEVAQDPFMKGLQRWWRWQQLPYAVVLFACGGIGLVLWGMCLRIVVSLVGHWLIGYFAHNHGVRDWHLEGHAVQGYNLPHLGLLTMGESWHNNHHAFPGSAQLGIKKGQHDPAWWVLSWWEKRGWIWNVKRAEDLPERPELQAMNAG